MTEIFLSLTHTDARARTHHWPQYHHPQFDLVTSLRFISDNKLNTALILHTGVISIKMFWMNTWSPALFVPTHNPDLKSYTNSPCDQLMCVNAEGDAVEIARGYTPVLFYVYSHIHTLYSWDVPRICCVPNPGWSRFLKQLKEFPDWIFLGPNVVLYMILLQVNRTRQNHARQAASRFYVCCIVLKL